jgi:ABC-type lipopolysaccharide export system ATPase subunit
MARLGLSHVARSTVLSGTGVSGVSGGERRRVAIGMELVIDPQVSLQVQHALGTSLCYGVFVTYIMFVW